MSAAGNECVVACANRGQLLADVRPGFCLPGRSQRPTNPLGRRHPILSGEPLELPKLVVLEQDLKAFGHAENTR